MVQKKIAWEPLDFFMFFSASSVILCNPAEFMKILRRQLKFPGIVYFLHPDTSIKWQLLQIKYVIALHFRRSKIKK